MWTSLPGIYCQSITPWALYTNIPDSACKIDCVESLILRESWTKIDTVDAEGRISITLIVFQSFANQIVNISVIKGSESCGT